MKTFLDVATFVGLVLFLPVKVFLVFVFTTVRDVVEAIGDELRAARAARDADQWER